MYWGCSPSIRTIPFSVHIITLVLPISLPSFWLCFPSHCCFGMSCLVELLSKIGFRIDFFFCILLCHMNNVAKLSVQLCEGPPKSSGRYRIRLAYYPFRASAAESDEFTTLFFSSNKSNGNAKTFIDFQDATAEIPIYAKGGALITSTVGITLERQGLVSPVAVATYKLDVVLLTMEGKADGPFMLEPLTGGERWFLGGSVRVAQPQAEEKGQKVDLRRDASFLPGASVFVPPKPISVTDFLSASVKGILDKFEFPPCVRACIYMRPLADTSQRQSKILSSPLDESEEPVAAATELARLQQLKHRLCAVVLTQQRDSTATVDDVEMLKDDYSIPIGASVVLTVGRDGDVSTAHWRPELASYLNTSGQEFGSSVSCDASTQTGDVTQLMSRSFSAGSTPMGTSQTHRREMLMEAHSYTEASRMVTASTKREAAAIAEATQLKKLLYHANAEIERLKQAVAELQGPNRDSAILSRSLSPSSNRRQASPVSFWESFAATPSPSQSQSSQLGPHESFGSEPSPTTRIPATNPLSSTEVKLSKSYRPVTQQYTLPRAFASSLDDSSALMAVPLRMESSSNLSRSPPLSDSLSGDEVEL